MKKIFVGQASGADQTWGGIGIGRRLADLERLID